MRETLWAAYNGVTELIDHGKLNSRRPDVSHATSPLLLVRCRSSHQTAGSESCRGLDIDRLAVLNRLRPEY